MHWLSSLNVGSREIARGRPTYFVADIASSHDGELSRALDLIGLAAEAGADCAKFQHFRARDIVSDHGFRALGGQQAHQAGWKRSVYETFEQYETPRDWTDVLIDACATAGIEYMTTPYDTGAIELHRGRVKAWKIGSGDISWTAFLGRVADEGLPVFLATGASDMAETEAAVAAILARNPRLCLMQCNTNYTGDHGNFGHVNLRVLEAFARRWPTLPLGLSDHTPGHAAVLGAVALGACAVEKHFTDDNAREGPDHPFSMNPRTWREMVARTRELEAALGDGFKRVEANEGPSRIVQRRALRLRHDLPAGHRLTEADLEALRPCPAGALEPDCLPRVIGQPLRRDGLRGEALTPDLIGNAAAAA